MEESCIEPKRRLYKRVRKVKLKPWKCSHEEERKRSAGHKRERSAEESRRDTNKSDDSEDEELDRTVFTHGFSIEGCN